MSCKFPSTDSPLELDYACFSKIAELQENRFYPLKALSKTLAKDNLTKTRIWKERKNLFLKNCFSSSLRKLYRIPSCLQKSLVKIWDVIYPTLREALVLKHSYFFCFLSKVALCHTFGLIRSRFFGFMIIFCWSEKLSDVFGVQFYLTKASEILADYYWEQKHMFREHPGPFHLVAG